MIQEITLNKRELKNFVKNETNKWWKENRDSFKEDNTLILMDADLCDFDYEDKKYSQIFYWFNLQGDALITEGTLIHKNKKEDYNKIVILTNLASQSLKKIIFYLDKIKNIEKEEIIIYTPIISKHKILEIQKIITTFDSELNFKINGSLKIDEIENLNLEHFFTNSEKVFNDYLMSFLQD